MGVPPDMGCQNPSRVRVGVRWDSQEVRLGQTEQKDGDVGKRVMVGLRDWLQMDLSNKQI